MTCWSRLIPIKYPAFVPSGFSTGTDVTNENPPGLSKGSLELAMVSIAWADSVPFWSGVTTVPCLAGSVALSTVASAPVRMTSVKSEPDRRRSGGLTGEE